LSALEVARAAVRTATADQTAATQQQQEAIEKRLAEVKKALDEKKVQEAKEKEAHQKRLTDLENLIRAQKEKSRGREDAVLVAIDKIGARLTRLEQNHDVSDVLSAVATLADQFKTFAPKRGAEKHVDVTVVSSDSDSDYAATDIDDVESCTRANARWSKLERQLPHTEKATGSYSALQLTSEQFNQEWRRRLRSSHNTPQHHIDAIESQIKLLTNAHSVITLARSSEPRLRHHAHTQLRLNILQSSKLQLQLRGNMTSEAYDKLETDLNAAHAKNRRGKGAYIGYDGIVAAIMANRKLRQQRGRGRGGHNRRGSGRGPPGIDTDPVISDTASTASTADSKTSYRRRR